jgi:hypothetical protein
MSFLHIYGKVRNRRKNRLSSNKNKSSWMRSYRNKR